MKKHSQADVLVSFASLRSAYESTVETMQYPQVGVIEIQTFKHLSDYSIEFFSLV